MNELINGETFKAQRADEEIQRAFRSIETRWTELAVMLVNFHNHEWYRQLGFQTFDTWLGARVSECRASCRKKMRFVEELSQALAMTGWSGKRKSH